MENSSLQIELSETANSSESPSPLNSATPIAADAANANANTDAISGLGFSSNEASQMLFDELLARRSSLIASSYDLRLVLNSASSLLHLSSLLYFICVAGLFVSYAYLLELNYLLEGILLVAIYLLDGLCSCWIAHLTSIEYCSLLLIRLDSLKGLKSIFNVDNDRIDLPPIPSQTQTATNASNQTVACRRDGVWRNISIHLLVPGDLIDLLHSPHFHTSEISRSAPLAGFPHYFLCSEFPVLRYLDSFHSHSSSPSLIQPPQSTFRSRLFASIQFRRRFLVLLILIYLVIYFIRMGVTDGFPSNSNPPASDREWFSGLFYRSALLIIPILGLFSTSFNAVIHAFGNGYLIAVSEAVRRRAESGAGPSSALNIQLKAETKSRRNSFSLSLGGANSVDQNYSRSSSLSSIGELFDDGDVKIISEYIDDLNISFSSIWSQAKRILFGSTNFLTRNVDPLTSLGGVTVFCCLDNQGILSENEPSPDHLLFLDGAAKPVLLDLINDPSSANGIVIEGEWNQHLPSLKPIGLVCILNNSCNLPNPIDNESDADHSLVNPHESSNRPRSLSDSLSSASSSPVDTCLCSLAREFGFDVNFIRKQFFISQVFHRHFQNSKPTAATRSSIIAGAESTKLADSISPSLESPVSNSTSSLSITSSSSVTSIAIQDRFHPSRYQYFSNGSVPGVLESCDLYWDGVGLQTLEFDQKQQLMGIFQQWNHHDLKCLAFSYRPIEENWNSKLARNKKTTHAEVFHNEKKIQINANKQEEADTSGSNRKVELFGSTEEKSALLYDGNSSSAAVSSGLIDLVNSRSSEIFLGMLAMRDQPKAEIRSLVEHLMSAGIRFVYFSSDDERKTQAFGTKIGLFSDFNVWISMLENAEKRNGKSQLPCGVHAIRDHIDKVDNVPLLVSLFTDSTPSAALEMIRIYQENGESVFCIGSSVKSANSECFRQSDISVALDPIPTKQCMYQPDAETGNPRLKYSELREFAALSAIISLPTAYQLTANSDLNQFLTLICEGRRLLTSMNQSQYFYFAVNLMIFIIQFISFVIHSPSPFTGYQLIWLQIIIIPLLSLSLAFGPRESDQLIRLADKNSDHLKEWKRFAAYFLARFFPSACIYLFFYLWFLHSTIVKYSLFSSASGYYWSRGSLPADSDPVFRSTRLAIQNYSLVVFVFILITLSSGFLSRFSSIRVMQPWENRVWMMVTPMVFAVQILFAFISIKSHDGTSDSLNFSSDPRDGFSWYLFVVWPILIVFIDEYCKIHDRTRREREHKKARQHFDTVLGMHSPK